ncbi:TPA: hypothetical protein N0F65_005297 [Lagenidium giganteum]|uniref:PiggyBac transposable element-derived protein domain-containing protein n=1 Tax=Lagenidium giganteum TaxID=4803 RepID=A0AAV2YWR6_9STRA|nr:TPA: hypothetical protein N0F65_005297 [Lagenidium giganteum]
MMSDPEDPEAEETKKDSSVAVPDSEDGQGDEREAQTALMGNVRSCASAAVDHDADVNEGDVEIDEEMDEELSEDEVGDVANDEVGSEYNESSCGRNTSEASCDEDAEGVQHTRPALSVNVRGANMATHVAQYANGEGSSSSREPTRADLFGPFDSDGDDGDDFDSYDDEGETSLDMKMMLNTVIRKITQKKVPSPSMTYPRAKHWQRVVTRQVSERWHGWETDPANSPLTSRIQVCSMLKREMPFEPHEYVKLVGLMIARMMCPHKERLSRHWSPVAAGAIPAGTFGRYMPRNRFNELMRNLHFTDNLDPRAPTDRAWKVRNEVYCGKNQHETTELDAHARGAAVLRNLKCLAFQLLHRNVYIAGTVMTNRLGLPKHVLQTKTIKKNDRKRGDIILAVAKQYPVMPMLSWMDSKPVYFLWGGWKQEVVQTIERQLSDPRPPTTASTTVYSRPQMVECPDIYVGPDGRRKRRQRACKVCSLLQRNADPASPKRKTTKYYCDACSEGDKRLYLCSVPRHPRYGDNITCFQIWHGHWDCGVSLPVMANKKIQMRKPGKKRSQQPIFNDDEQ